MEAVDGQLLDDFSSSQWSLAGKHIANNADTSCARVLVEAQFGSPSLAACNKHRTKERQEPDQILCRQQVQRASLAPRADDRTLLHSRPLDISSDQSGAAHTQRERCSTCILCLDTAQFLHEKPDIRNAISRPGSEPLSTQAQQANLIIGQGNRHVLSPILLYSPAAMATGRTGEPVAPRSLSGRQIKVNS